MYVGAVECTFCAAGYYKLTEVVKNTTYTTYNGTLLNVTTNYSTWSCPYCTSGYYSKRNSLNCTACDAGEESPQNASTGCKKCGIGYYAEEEGTAQCQACGFGKKRRVCEYYIVLIIVFRERNCGSWE